MNAPGRIECVPLRTAEGWDAARPAIEAFTAGLDTDNPWANAVHAGELHRLFWPGETVWWSTLRDEGTEPVGMMLLKQEDRRGRAGRTRVLRSLDAMVAETASLWCRESDRAVAEAVLAGGLGDVARATGADFLRLYRQPDAPARSLAGALATAHIPHETGLFTTAKGIVLPDDFEEYTRAVGSKRIRDIRRRARKLARETGTEPVFWMRSGDLFADPGFDATWRRLEDLRARSWQMEETAASGKADPTAVAAYTHAMAREWSRAGALEIAGYEVRGELVATHLNVRGGGRTWMVLMNHDPEWRSHGVGMQLLLRMLETAHARGDRAFELGGEATDWKADWTNADAPVRQLAVALPTMRGRAWGLAKRLRPGK